MLNKNEEVDILVLFLMGKVSILSLLNMILAVRFLLGTLYMLKNFPSVPSLLLLLFLIPKGFWILSIAFPMSIGMIMWFLFFILFMWYITFIDFRMLNRPCITGVNPTWSRCVIPFYMLLD